MNIVNSIEYLKVQEQETAVDSSVTLDTRLVTTLDSFLDLKDEWNRLYEKSDVATVFSSWEWMYTWWEVYQDQCQRKLYILCFYKNNKLVGIAPFQIDKFYPQAFIQGRTLRFIGLGDLRDDRIVSQYLDILAISDYEDEVVTAVSNYLVAHKRDWDFADLEYLLEDALVLKCFSSGCHGITHEQTEYGVRFTVPQMENFDDYLAAMGKRWRKMYTKKDRLLKRDGNVDITITDTVESIDRSFQQLSEMHYSRWKDRVDHCIFESQHFNSFHKKVLKRLLPEKKAFIKTLSLNGEALASYYFFTDKGQIHYYQSGFHSKYANKYSPLFLLVCKEVEQSIENKQLFDFMYTDSADSYKHSQYNAQAEKMYRLRWTSSPIRMFVFKIAKAMQSKIISVNHKIRQTS